MSQSEKRQKTELIQVRATPDEKRQLQKRAAAFDVSVGELVRQIIFGATPKAKVDQQAILELAEMRADLGRLGGLLKGWLGGSFPDAPAPDKKQVRDLLHEIQKVESNVLDAVKRVSAVK